MLGTYFTGYLVGIYMYSSFQNGQVPHLNELGLYSLSDHVHMDGHFLLSRS